MRPWIVSWSLFVTLLLVGGTSEAAHRWGLQSGTPELKSAGQLAFGPDGVLFVGDAIGANLYAIDTSDSAATGAKPARNITNLTAALTELPGVKAPVAVNDLAVNPLSGNLYLSISHGEAQSPALVKINNEGHPSLVSLKDVPFLKATVSNPPEDKVVGEGPRARNRRQEAITDLAFTDGKVLVSGLTTGDGPSKIREFPFPFADREVGTNVEIYHGAHGRVEDNSTVRTFIPMNIDGKPALLAGFTCTPLVRFSLDSIESGTKTRGVTVAELGNRNTPIDMLSYKQNGEDFLLMSNTARGVMKISTKDIGRSAGIEAPVRTASGTDGQTFETISDLEGTVQLDRLNEDHIVAVLQKDGNLTLRTVPLP